MVCLEQAALAVLDVRAVDRRVAQAAKKGEVTEWRRTLRHVSQLWRSHIPSPGGRASGKEGGHYRGWMSSYGRYYDMWRSPRLAATSVATVYVDGPRKRQMDAHHRE
uniref:Uncharacterized protein n=1 Tax=Peronospora matthiolae TaxID=2874970 RepID=A0AAV1VDN0_9STRA